MGCQLARHVHRIGEGGDASGRGVFIGDFLEALAQFGQGRPAQQRAGEEAVRLERMIDLDQGADTVT